MKNDNRQFHKDSTAEIERRQAEGNKSFNIANWTIDKLQDEALMYDDLIHGQNPCFGTKDVIRLDHLLRELEKRGVEVNNKLSFN